MGQRLRTYKIDVKLLAKTRYIQPVHPLLTAHRLCRLNTAFTRVTLFTIFFFSTPGVSLIPPAVLYSAWVSPNPLAVRGFIWVKMYLKVISPPAGMSTLSQPDTDAIRVISLTVLNNIKITNPPDGTPAYRIIITRLS